MATNFAHMDLEKAHFNNFFMHVPSLNELSSKQRNNLLDDGVIQVSTVFEQALAKLGGYTVVSEDTHDFCNGDDAKMCTVVLRSKGTNYTAQVNGVSNKTGDLRVQVYERITGCFYYFHIPNEAFNHLKVIEIRFNLDGTPKRSGKWWSYEVPSFEDLAKI